MEEVKLVDETYCKCGILMLVQRNMLECDSSKKENKINCFFQKKEVIHSE